MTLKGVIDLLRKQVGLDPASLGPTMVPTVVAARQRILGFADLAAYATHLTSSPQELEALVDDLVVPETWFFRGGKLFSYLAKHIRDSAETRPAGQPFRILSVPCSSGEEPYSLVIALAELQVPRHAWHLDAVDIGRRHLERARRGRYGAFSFRQTDHQLRNRYFTAVENEWEIVESLRSSVQYRQGNLIAAGFLQDELPYDLIFCRNLLIYLHDAARQQVVATLDRLLAPQGLISMGHAEPLNSIDPRFGNVGPNGYFLFCRSTIAERDEPPAHKAPNLGTIASGRSSVRTAKAAPPSKPKLRQVPRASTAERPPPNLLLAARMHADAGRLDAAWADCQTLLAASEPTAELYAMLGVIHKARHEDAESKSCFEKALYLQPNHSEAILHLMLLYEQEGAHSQAAVMRSRLERAGGGGEE